MSAEIRYVFIRKHITYLGFFIILWTFSLSHSYFQIFYAAQEIKKSEDENSDYQKYLRIDKWMMNISIYSSMMTGFIMSIIRAREPYFKFLIKKEICSWFGILMDENDEKNSKDYMNDSLATFLTSSLNVELVHVILEAITKHSEGIIDPTMNYLRYKPEQFKQKNQFIIDTIMIRNPDKWKVAILPEFLEEA